MKRKRKPKNQPLHPPKGRQAPPMSKKDQRVWVLLGTGTFLAAGLSFWVYWRIVHRLLEKKDYIAMHVTDLQIGLCAASVMILALTIFGFFAELYHEQPIWGIPGHHYGRTSVQKEVYPLLGPLREPEKHKFMRMGRNEDGKNAMGWLFLGFTALLIWVLCWSITPKHRLLPDGSVYSTDLRPFAAKTWEHSEGDTIQLRLRKGKDAEFASCQLVLTADGEDFSFWPGDFRSDEALAELAALFPAPEIDHPEWLPYLRPEDAARLNCLLPKS